MSNNDLNRDAYNEKNKQLEHVRVHLVVSGKVQGVYFRKHLQEISTENNVTGWVRNLKNGDVESILEGLKSDVDKVVEWCHKGPQDSRVDKVEILYERFIGEYTDFKIVY
ncbi:MAG: acylphosphatase [Nitrososphaeraceae archaeon]|nr:acylphosphatase [Nitrososphaeraceae archaeon]